MLDGRVRRPGAGRKRLRDRDPELEAALDALIDPDVRGDPESPLRWTCKSTGQLALALTRGGHPVSASTVGTMLHEAGYSLQANAKTKEGSRHPDRDAQFRYLNEQARESRDGGLPVVSVDAKKKELIGEFKNVGREWEPKGQPVAVRWSRSKEPPCTALGVFVVRARWSAEACLGGPACGERRAGYGPHERQRSGRAFRPHLWAFKTPF